ncbi:hypothetical protein M3Y97_00818000 [Aphelenchoides bicaudatus]|nr:hypothetical protein M3Y97_00818000 [Aphelenchoides bicaudatus]
METENENFFVGNDENVALIETSDDESLNSTLHNSKSARWVYIIFMLHGVGILLPWNAFLSISPQYFIDYKFTPLNKTEPLPVYTTYFFSYLGVCSQIPNLLLTFLNMFIVLKSGIFGRIVYSLITIFVICSFTTVFIFINTSSWMSTFFVLTMISVVILNSANGIYQNSFYGLTALFLQNYTNSVIIGTNVCGIAVAIVLILTLTFLENIQVIALIYFVFALVIILACLFSFLWLPKLEFYSYYTNQARLHNEHLNTEDRFTFTDFKVVLRQTYIQMLSVFLTCFVTLLLFPNVVSNVPVYGKYDFFLPEKLYVPINVFLNFNVFATIGSVLGSYVQWPKNKNNLIYPVAGRLLFIPFFLFCNYGGVHRNFPVLFTNEYLFILMLSLLALTHGYFVSISMMYAPSVADESNAKAAGMISGFFLTFGIACGVVLTFLEGAIFLKST